MIDPLTAEAWLHERDADCPSPGTETIERDDLLLRATPYAFPWASSVRRARWSEANAERGIDEVLAFFRARGRRFVWLVGPSSRPLDLGERLRARGFKRDVEEDERILAARLPIAGLAENRAVELLEVADEETLRASVELTTERWREDLLADRRRYLACRERRGGFLVARLDSVTVGTAGWTYTADGRAVLLNGGVVRPDFRRRGVYSAMVRWRAQRARERGCAFAVLIANPRTSGPILDKRGFVDLGAMSIYYSPP